MEVIVIFTVLVMICIGIYNSATEVEMEDTPYFHNHFDKVQFSITEFYTAIGELLIDKQIPGLRISIISRLEGGVFSPGRLYLRIRRKNMIIEVCSFHFGTGSFVSCRSGSRPGFKKAIFGGKGLADKTLDLLYYQETYYRADQQTMFKKIVNGAIGEVVASVRSTHSKKFIKE